MAYGRYRKRPRYRGPKPMITRKHKQWATGAIMMLVAIQTKIYSRVRTQLGI